MGNHSAGQRCWNSVGEAPRDLSALCTAWSGRGRRVGSGAEHDREGDQASWRAGLGRIGSWVWIDVSLYIALGAGWIWRLLMRVLVADDDVVHRTMAVDCLMADGMEVESVASAEQALALVRSGKHFDAIVTDYKMMGM